MNEVVVDLKLSALVDRAAHALSSARSSAEVLDARDAASFAYDQAKSAARIAKAKGAHDELIAAVRRAQAGALEIEATANCRLADEYDAAQDRGEVATQARHAGSVPAGNAAPATVADLGLTRKQIHEARIIRDAEQAHPGIVRRTLDGRLARGEEPTKAAVREAISAAVSPSTPDRPVGNNVVPLGSRLTPISSEADIQRDLLGEEAGADRLEAEDFDHARVDHRARAINGALSTFDHVRLSGAEYWSIYGTSPSRETFITWVRAAKSTIDDILKEYDHDVRKAAQERSSAEGRPRKARR